MGLFDIFNSEKKESAFSSDAKKRELLLPKILLQQPQ